MVGRCSECASMTRTDATNHTGWAVQELTAKGWIDITEPASKEEAEEVLKTLQMYRLEEHRVYETLKEKT